MPATQFIHDDAPDNDDQDPAEHGTHDDDPAGDHMPMLQLTHVEYDAAPTAADDVPGEQGKQAKDAKRA